MHNSAASSLQSLSTEVEHLKVCHSEGLFPVVVHLQKLMRNSSIKQTNVVMIIEGIRTPESAKEIDMFMRNFFRTVSTMFAKMEEISEMAPINPEFAFQARHMVAHMRKLDDHYDVYGKKADFAEEQRAAAAERALAAGAPEPHWEPPGAQTQTLMQKLCGSKKKTGVTPDMEGGHTPG